MINRTLLPLYMHTNIMKLATIAYDLEEKKNLSSDDIVEIGNLVSNLRYFSGEIFPHNCIINDNLAKKIKSMSENARSKMIRKKAKSLFLKVKCYSTDYYGEYERYWTIRDSHGEVLIAPDEVTDFVALAFLLNYQ